MSTFIYALSVFACYAALLVLIFYALINIIELEIEYEYLYTGVFGFGVLYLRNQDGVEMMSKLKKRDIGQERWFFDPPEWFNRHIYNFGVVPKQD